MSAQQQRYSFVREWGNVGPSQFQYPAGVAVDSSGYVYVVDSANSTIQKFTSNGKFVTKWGSLGDYDGQFDHPTGIAVDHTGNVYISDHDNSRIQKFDSNGKFLTMWGSYGYGDGKFRFADSIAVDNLGKNVYVSDSDSRSIKIFSLTPSTK